MCKKINEIIKIEGNTERFIIVQNTQKLAKKTAENFESCKLIISDLTQSRRNVINTVLDFLKKPNEIVLIISDKTFFKIPIELLKNWQIWLDDVTNFHSYKNINDGNQRIKDIIFHDLMQDHEIVDENTERYLTAKKKIVKGDLLSKIAHELSVLSENDIFIMNNDYFTDKNKVQSNVLGWKNLEKHIGMPITFMGANFENSLIYKGKSDFFEKICLDGLQQRTIPLNRRIKVYYFLEKRKISRTWKINNSEKVKQVYDYLRGKLEGKEYYWTNNNNDRHQLDKKYRISPDTRGLNDYNKIDTCVWLACMRPDDTEAKLCELLLKITGTDIHQAREYESLHQFALRGISRQFDSAEMQIVYVFDKYQAESLSSNIEYIPGVLEDIEPGKPGRPKGAKNVLKLPPLSGAASKRLSRWLQQSPRVDIESFKTFLASKSNQNLSTEDIASMWGRYEKAIKKIKRD
ncbi:type III restriction endonuclease subunit R [Erwinia rhapontici]|uniref:type III restriction endonuclease subunit R n=1 Tax=Erwinia rhapontici TaxID=55212 RepID=UPI002166E3EE|nr:type III restriction endonuclease subunit R [Erwinia rhapontici]MCS3607944.1 hypothetical protein [Erwinia rhapontici]